MFAGYRCVLRDIRSSSTTHTTHHRHKSIEPLAACRAAQMSLHPQSRQLIKLTTHPSNFGVDPEPLKWGAREPLARGPVVATVSRPGNRNAIGAHGGTYSVYRAVAMAAQKASSDFVPDYTNTLPPEAIGPFDAWFGTKKIVSLDPWGHVPQSIWADRIADRSLDIRPTIAVTKSHLDVPEIKTAVADGRMKAGGAGGLDDDGNLMTTKAAIEPVWYLPGVAERFGVDEGQLRRLLYEQTGGMFPELVTRPDLKLFLPPINGVTVYIVGDVSSISKPDAPLVVRLHDESCAAPRNSARNYSARKYSAQFPVRSRTRSSAPSVPRRYDSDIFQTDGSTCRPWLVYGITECIKAAQQGLDWVTPQTPRLTRRTPLHRRRSRAAPG